MKTIKLELTEEELHDLYDMLYILNSGDIKINKLTKSWNSIFERIEPIIIPELYENKK